MSNLDDCPQCGTVRIEMEWACACCSPMGVLCGCMGTFAEEGPKRTCCIVCGKQVWLDPYGPGWVHKNRGILGADGHAAEVGDYE